MPALSGQVNIVYGISGLPLYLIRLALRFAVPITV